MSTQASSTVESHFARKTSQLRAIYQRLLTQVADFGPFEEVPKRASIHLQRGTVFADIQLRTAHFNLEFKTDYAIDHPRITKHLRLSAHRFAHTIKIESATVTDNQVLKCLKDAYDLCT
jgi:Domain of unknown function (DUF5655)